MENLSSIVSYVAFVVCLAVALQMLRFRVGSYISGVCKGFMHCMDYCIPPVAKAIWFVVKFLGKLILMTLLAFKDLLTPRAKPAAKPVKRELAKTKLRSDRMCQMKV